MPPPLTSDGQVTYADGTKPTVDQMAKDVAAFLVWTAEPKLEQPHAAGPGGRDLPAVRDDPRLFRLPADLGRGEARGPGDRGARSGEPGQDPPRQGKAGRRRLSLSNAIESRVDDQERAPFLIVCAPSPRSCGKVCDAYSNPLHYP